ncbi:MAG: hypothetical protein HYV15_00290, partial [Elusimicrobia bacterium]|nr:hypothetical protein [Elusimicrobiota bacterium]
MRAACLRRRGSSPRHSPERYQLHATLGEAALVLREPAQAAAHYARAAAAGRGRYADLSSTRRQAGLLLRAAGSDEAPIAALRVPRVVVFSGHMIDRRGRRAARFPRRLEPRVRAELRERLRGLDAGIGYASAACGADILFLEEMLRRGGEVRVVLPSPPEKFRRDSVDAAGAGWGRRFDAVLARAA